MFRDIAHDTLGPGARLYWDQAVYKKPGNPEEFPWHQDNGYTFTAPQQYLTCWVPLNDATLDNGCPWVVPGIHRLGTLRHDLTPLGLECLKDPEDAVSVPARAGDVVVFSSLTPHSQGLHSAVRVGRGCGPFRRRDSDPGERPEAPVPRGSRVTPLAVAVRPLWNSASSSSET